MPDRREQRSLFGEILDWMLAPLLLLWPMSVALTWLVAQNIANRPFDRDLAEMARTVARQVEVERTGNAQPGALDEPARGDNLLETGDARAGSERLSQLPSVDHPALVHVPHDQLIAPATKPPISRTFFMTNSS